MSDGDLRFPPAKKRDPAKFEPPPWERELFDELAKTRGTQEPPAAEARPAEEPTAAAGAEAEANAPAAAEADKSAAGATEAGKATSEGDGAGEPPVPPERVELMMMSLRAEEPRPQEVFWKVRAVAGGVSALIGLVISAWGVTAFATVRGGGTAGLMFASLILVCGVGFTVGGVWLVVKTMRDQGVL